ncbi:hypothetical protein [Kribbella caucasensis]|nr:hypothetical protein [Kribbella sp. VKM Ac-2527]
MEHLIVHNGDRIRATAQFVISPTGATTLHGQAAVPLTDPIACSDNLKVPVHGLIPSKLVDGGTTSGNYYGNATIIGTWSDGQIQIEQHLPPDFDAFFPASPATAPHTPAQLAPARAAVEALMRNTENGISMIGGGTGHNQIQVRLLIVTEPIYRRFEPIGSELVDLRPTIVPAPGG